MGVSLGKRRTSTGLPGGFLPQESAAPMQIKTIQIGALSDGAAIRIVYNLRLFRLVGEKFATGEGFDLALVAARGGAAAFSSSVRTCFHSVPKHSNCWYQQRRSHVPAATLSQLAHAVIPRAAQRDSAEPAHRTEGYTPWRVAVPTIRYGRALKSSGSKCIRAWRMRSTATESDRTL